MDSAQRSSLHVQVPSTENISKPANLDINASTQAAHAEAASGKKIEGSTPSDSKQNNALLRIPVEHPSLKMAFSANIGKKIVTVLQGSLAAHGLVAAKAFKGIFSFAKSVVKGALNASGMRNPLDFGELKQIAATEKLSTKGSVAPAVGDEVSTGGKLKGRDQYETIHKEFECNGVVYGKEDVIRTDTITNRKNSLDAKKEFLEAKLKDPALSTEDKKFIHRQIEGIEKDLASLKNTSHTDWVSSNHSRDVLTGNGIEKDRKNMISCSVNLREQQIHIEKPNGTQAKISMLRYGAIWDPRNGLTSMPELKSLDAENKACQGDQTKIMALNARIDARLKELNAMQKERKSDDQQFIIAEAKRTIEAFRPGSFSSVEQKREIIQDREKFLRDQTLDPIKLHLKNNISKMIKDKSSGENVMRMTHIGLLNSEAPVDFQENGWAHIESNQIADMQAAFASIDNLKIKVRNEPGTFFDEQKDGSVVMYVSAREIGWKGNIPSEIKLETCFVNLSVQGHTTNDGMQAEINRAGIAKLASWIATSNLRPEQEKELTEELNSIKARLEGDKHESSFDLAAELSLLADKVSAMSEGCLSCKDRGGTVAEMIGIKAMQRAWTRAPIAELKKHAEAFKKFFNEMLDASSPCIQVINDCTGTGVAKVDIRELKAMDRPARVTNAFKLAAAAATGGFNIAPEVKPQFLPLDTEI